MDIFLVGGAVRDKLLGLPVKERDWVVVGADPQQMLELGYRQVGKDFPVFLHPGSKEEYALARTERKTGPGYKGFEFHAGPGVTLEQDLLRRDLTINAIAENAAGELIDPYGGQADLAAGRLRHVSPAFAEDPVRILRVARFAARFGKWGFSVAHGTNALMRQMVANGEVDHLVPERVWAELSKALACDNPERFFSVLHGCHALAVLFPEVEREYSAHQAHVQQLPRALQQLQAAARASGDAQVRFAVLMLALGADLDKQQRLRQVETLCERYRLPNDYTRLATLAVRMAERIDGADPDALLDIMEASGAFQDAARWQQLLEVYRIAGLIDAATAQLLDTARTLAATVNAASLDDQTLTGPAVGRAIKQQRRRLIASIVQPTGQPE
jgi:tRNA nucleotidyltransferase (CCA-adding enzyme)